MFLELTLSLSFSTGCYLFLSISQIYLSITQESSGITAIPKFFDSPDKCPANPAQLNSGLAIISMTPTMEQLANIE